MENTDNENELYRNFKHFLQDYFYGRLDSHEESKDSCIQTSTTFSSQIQITTNDSLTDQLIEERAIPGGRYGCAQFIKACGNSVLKQLSLGKIGQMVQRAINEDFLRYQKTLLVLTECIDKTKVLEAQASNHSSMTEEEIFKHMQKRAEICAKLQSV